jgi:hypothetical protein
LGRYVLSSTSRRIRLVAQTSQEGLDFEGNHTPEELAEFASVMKKLLRVRDVVLRVNEEYIRSAAQADAYRTEPPFRLQGSYRNMNRLAEKISPVMNEAELEAVLQGHYRNEAQTLTQGAESNLLRFKELTGTLTAVEVRRWDEIKKIFRKNLLLHSGDDRDPVNRVIGQLSAFNEQLGSIEKVLAGGFSEHRTMAASECPMVIIVQSSAMVLGSQDGSQASLPANDGQRVEEVRISPETLRKIWELVQKEKPELERKKSGVDGTADGDAGAPEL